MLSDLTGKIGRLMGGLAGRAGGLAPRAGNAVMGAYQFAARNPTLVGAALGGAGGYMASDGSVGGTLGGATIGAIGGRRGWMRYQEKVNRKSGGLVNHFNRARQRASAKVGGFISKHAPDQAARYGPHKMNVSFDIGTPGKPMMQHTKMDYDAWDSMNGNIRETMKHRRMVGHARNLGGKKLGAMAVGMGTTLGAGVMAGFGYSAALATPKAMANTFGSQMGAAYGNAFSGMGNGTVTGY